MSRKTATFFQLLEYINKPKEKGRTPILFNLQNNNDDLVSISEEFIQNDSFRKQRSQKRNALYHEILSFPEEDKKHMTFEIMKDLCTKYLELRSPEALAYSKIHGDTKNPHIHIMISANDFRSPTQKWISKKRFKEIKQELDFYKRQKYPQLAHGLPIIKTKFPQRQSLDDTQIQMKKRGETSQKEKLKILIMDFLEKSKNPHEYKEKLENSFLKEYKRSEKTTGIIDLKTQKKYRYKTLGLQEDYEKFQRRIERLKGLQTIQEDKFQMKIKEQGFQEDILNNIQNNKNKLVHMTKKQIKRIRESKKLRRKKNRINRRQKRSLNLPDL